MSLDRVRADSCVPSLLRNRWETLSSSDWHWSKSARNLALLGQFWVYYSLLTSQSSLPRGKHNSPHLRIHRKAHVFLFLSSPAQTPIYHQGRDWKYSWSFIKLYFAIWHLHWYSKICPLSFTPRHEYLGCLHHSLCSNNFSLLFPGSVYKQTDSCAWCEHNPSWILPLPFPNFFPLFHHITQNLFYIFVLVLLSCHLLYWNHPLFLNSSQCYKASEALTSF